MKWNIRWFNFKSSLLYRLDYTWHNKCSNKRKISYCWYFFSTRFFSCFFRAVPEGIFNISQEERKNVCWTDQKEKEEDLSSISSFCPPEGIQARRWTLPTRKNGCFIVASSTGIVQDHGDSVLGKSQYNQVGSDSLQLALYFLCCYILPYLVSFWQMDLIPTFG